jgi:hypothetical protein
LTVKCSVDLLRHRNQVQGAVEKQLNGLRDAERFMQHVVVFDAMDRYVGLICQPGVNLIQVRSQPGNQALPEPTPRRWFLDVESSLPGKQQLRREGAA